MSGTSVKFQNVSDSAVKAEIEIKAAPDHVYAAWTNPELLPKWFGPREGGSLQIDHFDCTVGGRYDVTMVFSDGDRVQIVGKYKELDPPKKIVLTWQWSGSAGLSNETLVTVDLTPSESGTRLTLITNDSSHPRFETITKRAGGQSSFASPRYCPIKKTGCLTKQGKPCNNQPIRLQS